ncbi:CAAD domain-containing protein [Cyanobacterium stanieri LEGE 03274]|uniref:CAAD domain-containing protein n=1 Tax=Cyanobacterium stanieri LEGE 03274 TaxID=1828756 RepID=A0ABR9V5Z6_9CHRO|nr:CAAD domain-containing protein [Cyanobacterium stanieri]MBE9223313.1 CAAD domain-containing protein [Cyanobacterium stanieri LEGE 03274]
MESQFKDTESKTSETMDKVDNEMGGIISASQPASGGEQPWQEWVDVAVDFLSGVPEQLGNFFGEYKQPLTTLGLIVTAAVTVYITLSVLDAIGNIPLLSSILELVGLGYSAWFTTRYLLKASTREELFAEFNGLKKQILGGK